MYRATDTRLGREVALKLLPTAFVSDPERLARFEREARLLASLNHTSIAHLYGFETASLEDGSTVHLIAMELVEGEDLAERLKRGAIPVDEAIAIAKQIAEAPGYREQPTLTPLGLVECCRILRRVNWRIRFAVPWLLAASTGCGSSAPPRAVVLVTIDTLRADHLGCYGYPRPTSPFLDRLGREGVLFENAVSPVAQTSPAHASIMSGLYMAQHGVVRNGMGLAPLVRGGGRTLADRFRLAGYDSAAFTAVGFLKGVTRGFRTVDVGTGWRDYRRADATVEAALRWLQGKRTTDRFFLWIHLFDPHKPQHAPQEDVRAVAFASPVAEQAFARTVLEKYGVRPSFFRSSDALLKRYLEYDAEIHFADRQLARLHEHMESAGQNAGTLWIVTADHGEALGSHDLDAHGENVYREQLRVPLIFWARGRIASGRVSELVQHVDLLPTLAQLYGWDLKQAPGTLPGRSLVPRLENPAVKLPHTLAFAQRRPPDSGWEPGDVFTLFDQDWKYIVHTKGQDEFFDLRKDPLELTNLAASASSQKDQLAHLSRATFARLSREGMHVRSRSVDPAQQEQLRALGYVN